MLGQHSVEEVAEEEVELPVKVSSSWTTLSSSPSDTAFRALSVVLLVLLLVLLESSVELQRDATGSSGGDDRDETEASSSAGL